MLRDITETDAGRAGHGRRLAVIAAGAAVIAALVAVQHGPPPAASAPRPTPAPLPRSAGLVAADFHGYRDGWLATGTGPTNLWQTTDGGLTWKAALYRQGVGSVDRVHLFGSGHGYLLLLSDAFDINKNYMLVTTDAWSDWQEFEFPKPRGFELSDLYLSPGGAGRALFSAGANGDFGNQSAALYSTANGSEWTLTAQVDAEHRTSNGLSLEGSKGPMAFTDPQHGVIATQLDASRFGVYSTADGGASWSIHPLQPPGVEHNSIGPAAVSLAAVDGVLLLGVAFQESTTPPGVFVYRSLDQGVTWSLLVEAPTVDGVSAPVFAGSQAWWLPDVKAVEVTTDGGRNWIRTELGLPGTTRVQAVFPIDDRRAWAFAGGSFGAPTLLYETTDGGSTWFVRRPPG